MFANTRSRQEMGIWPIDSSFAACFANRGFRPQVFPGFRADRIWGVREPPLHFSCGSALRSIEHCLEDGCGRTSERIGGGESCLVGYGCDEFTGPFFVQSPGVEANGDDGRRLDEGCDLLVEAGYTGGGRTGDVLENLLVRVAGAQDQAVGARGL